METRKPSSQDEYVFMDQVLSGLESNFRFTASSTLVTLPNKKSESDIKREPTRLPTGALSSHSPALTSRLPSPSRDEKSRTLTSDMTDEDMLALFEGAETWDWSDMISPVKARPMKGPPRNQNDSSQVKGSYVRCIVRAISASFGVKHLNVETVPEKTALLVILKDDWIEVDVQIDDIVNIVKTKVEDDFHSPIIISSKENLLITHPDILLTATSIANAPQCLRRPALSVLTRSGSDPSPALVWGNILHEVMQCCLENDRWDGGSIDEFIDNASRNNLYDLLRISVSLDHAKVEVKRRAQGILTFGKRYIGNKPKADAPLLITGGSCNSNTNISISRLRDVEEDIWSPKYGLKGKIDASVEAVTEERGLKTVTRNAWTMPLEIKTGQSKAGIEHRAQTILYSLLMEDRYGLPVPSGLLYYTQDSQMMRVPAGRNEIKCLILARNELARYIAKRSHFISLVQKESKWYSPSASGQQDFSSNAAILLPPAVDNERVCKSCYAVDACMLYRKATDPMDESESSIGDLYKSKTAHLSDTQVLFFKQWDMLITLEEQDMMQLRKEMWTMNSQEREKKGRCWSSMILDTTFRLSNPPTQPLKGSKIHRFSYKFVRGGHRPLILNSDCTDILKVNISVGDPIVISVEPHILALARGFVVQLSPTSVVVSVDHSVERSALLSLRPGLSDTSQTLFRIDKDELATGMGRIRDNLARIFYESASRHRLELIVDLKMPNFDESSNIELSCVNNAINHNQQQAIEKVLQAKDYALLLGMPGTGKTTTIAELIKLLVHMGKTVLLTSYTHSAVDTILLKLKTTAGFDILRLGNVEKVHPDVHPLMLNSSVQHMSTEELETKLLKPPVVATTCLSIDHALFLRRNFDYCIVDEASQITLPACLGPIRFAQVFILVGDHFQLPPLVKNHLAREGGLDVSLFRRLCDAHPNAVVELSHQYRMCSDIMMLSNKLIYGGRLVCGSEIVAQQSLQFPHPKTKCTLHDHSVCQVTCWLSEMAKEERKAVFVDTDPIGAEESRIGDLVQNETEAFLIRQLVDDFLEGGISEQQIGVITPYRQQVKLLSQFLKHHKQVEILTADQSQGKDKDCILISLVRSNTSGQIGELIKDWRRMNVTFTRARKKLIIFGSNRTLRNAPLLAEFLEFMRENHWIFSIPPSACQEQELIIQKRRAEDHEEIKARSPIRTKRTKITGGPGFLRGRPVLRDIVNGM